MKKSLTTIIVFISCLISVSVLATVNHIEVVNHTGADIDIAFTGTGCWGTHSMTKSDIQSEVCQYVSKVKSSDTPTDHKFSGKHNLHVHWVYSVWGTSNRKFAVGHGRYVICPDKTAKPCKLVNYKNNSWLCTCQNKYWK